MIKFMMINSSNTVIIIKYYTILKQLNFKNNKAVYIVAVGESR